MLDSYIQNVEILVRHMPDIHKALKPDVPLEELDGWRAMEMRYQAFKAQGGEPVLNATLYGPSGAGKSTLFRQLTGLDVPAGSSRRPMTYTCVAAVPQRFSDQSRLARLFPHFHLERLTDLALLGKARAKPFAEAGGASGLGRSVFLS
jgi:hypothetical protein